MTKEIGPRSKPISGIVLRLNTATAFALIARKNFILTLIRKFNRFEIRNVEFGMWNAACGIQRWEFKV